MNLIASFQRYLLLAGFWKNRTSLYRDLASSLKERELPKDFIDGELRIAVAPMTADKHRARGLMYMHNVMSSGDPSLHEVLVATMPSNDSMALTVLKDASDRAGSLQILAKTVDDQNELTKMVRQALVSPLILMPVGFAFAYLLSSQVIPAFSKDAPAEVWTGYPLVVRVAAEWVASVGPFAAGGLVAGLVWLFVWALPNMTKSWRFRCENATGTERVLWILLCPIQPVFAMYRDIQGTRMLGNLANLLQSKMLLLDALSELAEGAQPWMRRHLLLTISHLQQSPGDYVGAFSHGIMSKFLLGRLNSMVRRDSGGKFDDVLIKLGGVGQAESREAVRKSAVKINAILLITTLAVIMFFYVGQAAIVRAIEDANSPSAVLKRAAKKQQLANPKNQPSGYTSPSSR